MDAMLPQIWPITANAAAAAAAAGAGGRSWWMLPRCSLELFTELMGKFGRPCEQHQGVVQGHRRCVCTRKQQLNAHLTLVFVTHIPDRVQEDTGGLMCRDGAHEQNVNCFANALNFQSGRFASRGPSASSAHPIKVMVPRRLHQEEFPCLKVAFDRVPKLPYFLRFHCIAVKSEEEWQGYLHGQLTHRIHHVDVAPIRIE
mmetsp:Transcript_97746/g.252791  ORF Transcript_97746/g.252791 Transcript_97746/m.252791 type:complete len:200 (-) Transcript_97746:480-1079(-)